MWPNLQERPTLTVMILNFGASPENWKKLATGEMGPRAAMLTKRLKLKGSMITAMRYMSAFEESLKMMSKVPTLW